MSKTNDLYSTKIEKYIYGLIEKKVLKEGDRLAPEREIAQKFKISNTPVRQATRKLVDNGILERIPGKGIFVRSEKAPDVTTNRIAVVHCHRSFSVFASSFFRTILEGVDGEARHANKRLLFCGMQDNGEFRPEDTLYDLLPVVDGFILVGLTTPIFNRIRESLRHLCKPVVVVNYGNVPDYIDSVTFDNKANTREMVSFLLDSGHRRITHICGKSPFPRGSLFFREERLEVFKEALHERGIGIRDGMVMEDYTSGDTVRLEKLLRSPEAPTALFCSDDALAFRVMEDLKSLHIRVPEDVTVTGYDGIPEAAASVPGLTTMETPLAEMGRMGVERLMFKMRKNGKERVNPMKIVLSSRLVKRGTHKDISS